MSQSKTILKYTFNTYCNSMNNIILYYTKMLIISILYVIFKNKGSDVMGAEEIQSKFKYYCLKMKLSNKEYYILCACKIYSCL